MVEKQVFDPGVRAPTGKIALQSMGLATDHAIDYIADYPNGQPHYGILVFHTPFIALTANGYEEGRAGDVMLVAPNFPQWHRGLPGKSFINDWVFAIGEPLLSLISDLGLPVNLILPMQASAPISKAAADIFMERASQLPCWEEMLDLHFRRLLTLIARNRSDEREMPSGTVPFHREKLVAARLAMLNQVEREWRVHDLARMTALSDSRFAVLYKASFGVSPMEDLIRARLELATVLLNDQNLSVGDVATRCGFSTLFYFSRQFKVRFGVSPSRYRGQ